MRPTPISTPRIGRGGAFKPGSLTVLQNGVLVQDHIPVGTEPHTAAAQQRIGEQGPHYLNDHGNPVRFHNIWLRPL